MDNMPKTLRELIGDSADRGTKGISEHRKAMGDYYRVTLLRKPYERCGFHTPKVIHEVCHPTYHRCGPCLDWLKAIPVALIPYHTIQVQYIESKL
jgi:hypothetical protein